jgi:hypothetical protein
MVSLDRKKFYDAIYVFLNETLDDNKAENQTNVMVENIIETAAEIEMMMTTASTNIIALSKKFHTLKNLLLYGDFYYESDLCQDIEIELRKSHKISNISSMYTELIDSLKM